MGNPDELARTVRAAAAGDEQAWSVLVTRFGAAIRSVARRHRLNHADQEEIVQKTWMRLFERIHTLRDPAAVAGWLATTARHESLRLQGTRSREILGAEVPETPAGTSVDEIVIAGERSRALHRAVERLDGRQRDVLRLQLTEPLLGYGEIGGTLGMPVGSIGPTLGRSLARLRRDPQLLGAVAA
jgi:RNA polymerase sigma factor (sigma-70 family)